MIRHSIELRVRYAETDQMGYVYYGNYATYFEVGRVELVRHMGVLYAELENKHGIMMPVLSLKVDYKRPALYDELITVETTLAHKPDLRLHFTHRILNSAGVLLVSGAVELVFVRKSDGRPVRPPQHFLTAVEQYWVEAAQ